MDEAEFAEKIARLEHTADDAERRSLALDLSETGDDRVYELLVRLIQRPDLENRRGTLIYCLEEFDCSSIVSLLASIAETGKFEAAAHADIILKEQGLR
jgi:hypothetical protein